MTTEHIKTQVANAQKIYQHYWPSISPPHPCDFVGTYQDVDALDYLHYEGIEFAEGGLFGVSLVWGDALRHHLGLEWCAHDDPRLFYPCLRSPETFPSFSLHPYPAVCEALSRSSPQFGKLTFAFEKVLLDVWLMLGLFDADKEHKLQQEIVALVDFDDEGFMRYGKDALDELKKVWHTTDRRRRV